MRTHLAPVRETRHVGSRKTHKVDFNDVRMVLSKLEEEANMTKEEKDALAESMMPDKEMTSKERWHEKKKVKATIGSWRLLLVIGLPMYTGFRRGDCAKIKWRDLMFLSPNGKIAVRDTISVTESKTQKRREIPISKDLRHYIVSAYAEIRPMTLDEFVFTPLYRPAKDYKKPKKAMSITSYTLKINDAFARFGIFDEDGYVSPHGLRKTYSWYLYKQYEKKHGSMYALMQMQMIMNHSRIETTMIYLDLRIEQAQSMHDEMSFRSPVGSP